MDFRDHPWIATLQQSEKVSETTKQLYITNLAIIANLLNTTSLETILSDPQRTIAAIEAKYENKQTQKACISAVKALYKYVPDVRERYAATRHVWHTTFKNLDSEITQRVATAEPTEREKINWVGWKDVLAVNTRLAASAYGSIPHLLLSMYCLIEPLRADYGSVKIVRAAATSTKPAGGNYIYIPRTGPAQLILNDYKTAKMYGQFNRDLPPELMRVIEASLRLRPREYLFVDDRGNPYDKANSYTRFANRILERIFDKKFTIRLLRHSYISNIDFNERTPGELMQHSHNMLHSFTQQQLYRRKMPSTTPPSATTTTTAAVSPQSTTARATTATAALPVSPILVQRMQQRQRRPSPSQSQSQSQQQQASNGLWVLYD